MILTKRFCLVLSFYRKNKEDETVVTFKKQTMVWLCENGVKKQIFNWEGETNVGAQCDWYCFDHVNQQLTGRLIEQPMFAHGYHCCSNYICSLPPPVINNESQLLFSSDITVMEMKNLIKGFCLYLVYYMS